jgi:hypothetical protein
LAWQLAIGKKQDARQRQAAVIIGNTQEVAKKQVSPWPFAFGLCALRFALSQLCNKPIHL